jgi:hypothetical protein
MILTGLLCFALGALIGAFLFNKFSPEQKKARDIVKHLHDQQEELKNYQQDVMHHFITSSRLLNQMSDSYAELHNHLATSADLLCGQNTITPIIQPIINTRTVEGELKDILPPLDYAPKTTPYDKGTLNEEYGLEKVHIDEPLTAEQTEQSSKA